MAKTILTLLALHLLIACRSDPGSSLPVKDSLDEQSRTVAERSRSHPEPTETVVPTAEPRHSPKIESPTQPKDIRSSITKTFLSQVGQIEEGKNNHGPAVKKYLASVGLDEGYAWCAAFVKWVLNENGFPAQGGNAWSPSWFPPERIIYQRNTDKEAPPRSGDVFGIYFSSRKRIAHVGFIHEWTDQYAITVEGNTNDAGSREGDGVYRKRRLKRQIYAVADWITH